MYKVFMTNATKLSAFNAKNDATVEGPSLLISGETYETLWTNSSNGAKRDNGIGLQFVGREGYRFLLTVNKTVRVENA